VRSPYIGPWPSYLFKEERTGPTDYLCEFDHEDIVRARRSILWLEEWEQQTQQVLGVLADLDLVRDGDRVLDFGCGIGRVTAALLARHRLTIQAVDRSPAMLRHARAHIGQLVSATPRPGAVNLCSDGELLAQAQASASAPVFDLVLLVEVVQHIPEPILDDLLPALARMTAPGGRLFIYGNDVLDVDRDGRISLTAVRDAVGRSLRVLRTDVWPFRPASRTSFVCAPRA
jgi:SAM-dependent methyltransferase